MQTTEKPQIFIPRLKPVKDNKGLIIIIIKTTPTEMDFIQKLRDIFPSSDRRIKDESPIFSTNNE
jgi:hypothetical protein